MDKIVIEILRSYISDHYNCNPDYDVFITWKCKTLQNYKYLLCTNLNDNKYYELTYNGDKKELYIDEYDKVNNVAVDMTDYID